MNGWTKTYVTAERLGIFPAEVAPRLSDDHTVQARFTRHVAKDIVAALARTRSARQEARVIVVEAKYGVGRTGAGLLIGQGTRYRINCPGLVWSEVWCQGEAHAGDADDLVTPVAAITRVEPGAPSRLAPSALAEAAYCAPCLIEHIDAAALQTAIVVTMLPEL